MLKYKTKMKTLKSLAILILVLTASVSVKAANNNDGASHVESEKIKNAINMPQSLKAKNGSSKITVYFSVNELGVVNEVCAVTDNKEAKKDIENQFMKLTFKGLPSCVRNSVDINFVVY